MYMLILLANTVTPKLRPGVLQILREFPWIATVTNAISARSRFPGIKYMKVLKNAAYEIIRNKGATYYAVALAVRRIVEAIVRNENSILTVSSLLEGQYGLSDVCLSVPTIVGVNGIEEILNVPFNDEEIQLLRKSGNTLKEIIKTLDI